MPNLLRFQLYSDPSRSTFAQIHIDIPVIGLPQYWYGQPVQLDGLRYVVANLSSIKREPDPNQAGKIRVIYEVYLAALDQWGEFGEPGEFEAPSDDDSLIPQSN